MSDIKTDVDGFATAIAQALLEYDQNVSDAVKKCVNQQAKETVDDIKAASPKKTGEYKMGWRKKKAYESSREKRYSVYNKDRYQLTHLLENGHVRKNTDRAGRTHISKHGWTAARVHIEPVEEKMEKGLEEKIEKAVKGL